MGAPDSPKRPAQCEEGGQPTGTSRPIAIKICCIGSLEEARLALRHGATSIGLVSRMPSGPGPIPEDLIAEIAAALPRDTDSVLLTSKLTVSEIAGQHQRCRTRSIQLCAMLPLEAYPTLRATLPEVRIIQALHVPAGHGLREAASLAAHVDAFLLDSGGIDELAADAECPGGPGRTLRDGGCEAGDIAPGSLRTLGGTGRTHDWEKSRAICEAVSLPVYLAGGLRPENVAAAIRQVRPYGVDVCTGVRTAGRLDEAKLREFIRAAREAQG
jgi:phosphoribosylanthranilate isomerase